MLSAFQALNIFRFDKKQCRLFYVQIRRIDVSRSNCQIFSFICHLWWMPHSQAVGLYPSTPCPNISIIRMRILSILSLCNMSCGCERLVRHQALCEANFNPIMSTFKWQADSHCQVNENGHT